MRQLELKAEECKNKKSTHKTQENTSSANPFENTITLLSSYIERMT